MKLCMQELARPTFPTKSEARAWGLDVRSRLSADELGRLSRAIAARIIDSDAYRAADTVLTYIGAKPGELDTRPVVEDAWEAGKRVLAPLCRPGGALGWAYLEAWTELERTRLGLLEPRESAARRAEPAGGLCLAPGVCFRGDGHRVGFGGGYYDRFLAEFSGTAVALAPEAVFGVGFPVEVHDVPVAVVVTEAGFYPVVENS